MESPSTEVLNIQIQNLTTEMMRGFADVGKAQTETNEHLKTLNGKVASHEKDLTAQKTINSYTLWFVSVVGIPIIAFMLYTNYMVPSTIRDTINNYNINNHE